MKSCLQFTQSNAWFPFLSAWVLNPRPSLPEDLFDVEFRRAASSCQESVWVAVDSQKDFLLASYPVHICSMHMVMRQAGWDNRTGRLNESFLNVFVECLHFNTLFPRMDHYWVFITDGFILNSLSDLIYALSHIRRQTIFMQMKGGG